MANEEEVMYLENLEEYIYDEDKVVRAPRFNVYLLMIHRFVAKCV